MKLSRSVWEKYKSCRDDRPLIRKEILWSVHQKLQDALI